MLSKDSVVDALERFFFLYKGPRNQYAMSDLPRLIGLYHEYCGHLSERQFQQAVDRVIKEQRYFPTISDILDAEVENRRYVRKNVEPQNVVRESDEELISWRRQWDPSYTMESMKGGADDTDLGVRHGGEE
jgi:hypothetical protein